MKTLIVIAAILTAGVSVTHAQQKPEVPDGWTKIDICHVIFYAPPDMKDLGMRGIDSCVAQFANKDITLYLDYGWYGAPFNRDNSVRDFNEQTLTIGGKTAQVITYVDASHSNSGLNYNASLYTVVKETEFDGRARPVSLMMSTIGERQKDRETALTIFRTIHLQ